MKAVANNSGRTHCSGERGREKGEEREREKGEGGRERWG